MPCYQKRFTTVNLDVSNLVLLSTAMESLGFSVRGADNGFHAYKNSTTVSFRKGERMSIIADRYCDTVQLTKDIKVAYATECVKHASKRFGWKLTKTGDKYTAVRKAWR